MMPKLLKMIDADFAQDMEYLNRRIQEWHMNKESFYPVLSKLDPIADELNADKPKWETPLTVQGGSQLYIRASGDGKLLTKIVRALRTEGWVSETARPEKGASGWWATFQKRSTEPGNEGRLYGRLELAFTSTVCKRVQVGTKMEEVPVFETQCDDLTIEEGEQDQLAGS